MNGPTDALPHSCHAGCPCHVQEYELPREHPTFPEPALGPGDTAPPLPSEPFDPTRAIDYRGNPSATGPEPAQGIAVPPQTDASIQNYDLPDQLSTYDRMSPEE